MTHYPLRITHYASRLTHHASRLTPHALRCALPLLIALLLIIVCDRHSPPGAGNETMDFIQMPYLHKGRICFGRNTLDDYRISSHSFDAGQSIHLTLDWTTAEAPLTATVSLVGMSEHLLDLNAPIVLSQATRRIDSTATLYPVSGTKSACRVACAMPDEWAAWEPPAAQFRTGNYLLPIPSDLPTGIYLLQVGVDNAGGELSARTANGTLLGRIYLQPVYIRNRRPLSDEPILAAFGDRIRLHAVDAEQLSPAQLLVRLDWSVSKSVAENYGISVRLYNAQGDWLTAIDTQPGHGFLPTVTWQPGEKITDRLMMPLPEGLPPRDDYKLEIILYDLANNLAGIGQYIQPGIALTHYARRRAEQAVLARFDSPLALATLDVPATHAQGAPVLSFHAGWVALTPPTTDVLTLWSLVDNAGNTVATQTVRLEAGQWPAGAYVRDMVHLPIPGRTGAGQYHLAVTLFEAHSGIERGKAHLEQTIEIAGHARRFDLPPLDHRAQINLGNLIELEGYNLARQRDAVRLELVWRAQQPVSTDYTVFVHLLDASGAIATQYDAMPLGNTYPTSWWMTGQVVTDPITLSLKELPPGIYHLAVGMYDGATLIRLEAYRADGQRLADDRLILPQDIQIDRP